MRKNGKIAMPSSMEKTYVQFYYDGENAPFICGAEKHVLLEERRIMAEKEKLIEELSSLKEEGEDND